MSIYLKSLRQQKRQLWIQRPPQTTGTVNTSSIISRKSLHKQKKQTLSGSVALFRRIFMRVYKVLYVERLTEGAVEAEREDVAVVTWTVYVCNGSDSVIYGAHFT